MDDLTKDAVMDETLIAKIANEVVNQTIFFNWKFYLLLICITTVVTCFSSYVYPYLAARGKMLASKVDFDNILSQLKISTQTTAEINQKISHNDWSLKELKLIKRNKLEEILSALYDTQEWLTEQMNNVLFDSGSKKILSPINKIRLISILYLPELADEISAFNNSYWSYKKWILEQAKLLVQVKSEEDRIQLEIEHAKKQNQIEKLGLLIVQYSEAGNKKVGIIDNASVQFQSYLSDILIKISAIEQKASALMKEVTGIELANVADERQGAQEKSE